MLKVENKYKNRIKFFLLNYSSIVLHEIDKNTAYTRLKNMVWFYYGRCVTLDVWLCRDLWKHASSPQVYRVTPNKQLLLYKPHFSTSFLILNDCCRKWLGYLQCIQLWHYVQKRKSIDLNSYLGKIKQKNKKAISYYNGQTLGRPFPNSFSHKGDMLLQHLETHCTSIAHCKLH